VLENAIKCEGKWNQAECVVKIDRALAIAARARIRRRVSSDAAAVVPAAICDTREVWASFFLPQDRARVIEYTSPALPSACRMRQRESISPPSRPRLKR
jgi:hypothetical protein